MPLDLPFVSLTRKKLYYTLLVLLTAALFVGFEIVVRHGGPNAQHLQKRVVALVSAFFNVFVLYYHFTRPPHPKFVMLKSRRVSLYVHIAAGIVEFGGCLLAYATGSPGWAVAAAVAAIVGHVPTSYYQTSVVFGAKAVMVSGYLFAISLHLFCAIHLLRDPASTYWLLNMFLILSIYVWVRVLYFFFSITGLFRESLYTTATLVSGMILVPTVLGAAGNLLFLGYLSGVVGLFFAVVRPNARARRQYVEEHARSLVVSPAAQQQWASEQANLTAPAMTINFTDRAAARRAFDALDTDGNGTLSGPEIEHLLDAWHLDVSLGKRILAQYADKPLTFNDFYRHVWRAGRNVSPVGATPSRAAYRAEAAEVQARAVFEQLDQDQNGYLDALELQQLLLAWGLPTNEIDAYLRQFSADGNARISLADFTAHMKPLWQYAYANAVAQPA